LELEDALAECVAVPDAVDEWITVRSALALPLID
jgi:hypothetical protein